jgi:hypothetical protein
VKLRLSHYGEDIDWGAFQDMVPRRIFGPKGKEMVGGLRRLHNEELHNLYISPILYS